MKNYRSNTEKILNPGSNILHLFKEDVLQKHYDNPKKCSIDDGRIS
jgi:hypothetical protein